MHGPTEVADDLRELCVMDAYAKDLKFMDYIWCRNAAIKNGGAGKGTDLASSLADDAWQSCAGDKSGFDMSAIKKCSEGNAGRDLLVKSFASSKALDIGAS